MKNRAGLVGCATSSLPAAQTALTPVMCPSLSPMVALLYGRALDAPVKLHTEY